MLESSIWKNIAMNQLGIGSTPKFFRVSITLELFYDVQLTFCCRTSFKISVIINLCLIHICTIRMNYSMVTIALMIVTCGGALSYSVHLLSNMRKKEDVSEIAVGEKDYNFNSYYKRALW